MDVLVDMLADEIERVRLAAVNALSRLRNVIEFAEHHLHVPPPAPPLPPLTLLAGCPVPA
eukprot:690792-Hanusia_phi.AAC.2